MSQKQLTMSPMGQLRAHSLYPTLTNLYVADETSGLRSNMTRSNRVATLKLLQRFRPEKRANEFTDQDLVDFLRSRPLAPRSARTYRTSIKAFFDWAEFRGYVPANPATHIVRQTNYLKNTRVRHGVWLERAEALRLLECCDDDSLTGLRDAVVLALMLLAGLRKSEVISLRWSDLNLHRRTLTLVGKGGKPAVVALAPPLVANLERWRTEYARAIEAVPGPEPIVIRFVPAGGINGSEKVLRPAWGVRVTKSTVDSVVRRRGREAGVMQLAPHDLRRTFAGLLEANGAPLRDIQLAMRHENIATTSAYLSSNLQRAASAIDRMAEGF